MTYNIDVFIRQLQSSIARRKEKISVFECIIDEYRQNYSVAKVAVYDYIQNNNENEDGDANVFMSLVADVEGWVREIPKAKKALKWLVEQQKTERKMLAYFINEKRYMTTKED